MCRYCGSSDDHYRIQTLKQKRQEQVQAQQKADRERFKRRDPDDVCIDILSHLDNLYAQLDSIKAQLNALVSKLRLEDSDLDEEYND